MTDYGRLHATARSSSSPGPRARLWATVIGELQRTFCGARLFGSDFPPFVHCGRLLGSARRGRGDPPGQREIDLIASVSGGIVITAGQRGGSPQFEVVLGGIRGETDARTRRSEWCQALYCEG
ncbi:hypothetical protein [Streptomyces europaeiscabiei]|uniref:hypothetical protein n=1 Tax=Streptomyces europaeiscabiei TaxID=146819 RepID=UPI0029BDE61E|nr:hypothetical protein [Streptomyces europaeiscabiei]MDX2766483.1 hypothetical protein [Streptomyces europaeiscabiei]